MKTNKRALFYLIKNSKTIFFSLMILTIIGMFVSYIAVQLALSSKNLIDIAVKSASGVLSDQVIIIAILIISQLLAQIFYSILNLKISGKYAIKLKDHLFNTILKTDYQKISEYHSGELLNRINSDISIITNGVLNIIPNAISLLLRIVLSFIALYGLDKPFALFCLLLGPIIIVSARIYGNKMKKYHKQCQETDGKTRSFMQEAIQNLLVIKAYKNEDNVTDYSNKLQLKNYKVTLKRAYISIIVNILFFLVLTAGYYVALAYCAYKISIGIMTVGTLTAILQLVGQVQGPFKDLSAIIPQYYQTIASTERVMELSTEPKISQHESSPAAHHQEQADAPPHNTSHCEQRKACFSNNYKNNAEHAPHLIEITNLNFAYKDEKIFEDANFTMEIGEFVAIAGISGIGKSTLLKIILGVLHPESGAIKINNSSVLSNQSNPRPSSTPQITQMTPPALRATQSDLRHPETQSKLVIAYVPQGNMILSGTIKENIAFYSPINDQSIIESAKTADIDSFIETLPNKYETILGEKGLGISEGQLQRLSIARAVYFNAPLLLLDESTSALDEQTEKKVLQNLKSLKKSVVIISHKKAALEIADKIIAIEDYKIKLQLPKTPPESL